MTITTLMYSVVLNDSSPRPHDATSQFILRLILQPDGFTVRQQSYSSQLAGCSVRVI